MPFFSLLHILQAGRKNHTEKKRPLLKLSEKKGKTNESLVFFLLEHSRKFIPRQKQKETQMQKPKTIKLYITKPSPCTNIEQPSIKTHIIYSVLQITHEIYSCLAIISTHFRFIIVVSFEIANQYHFQCFLPIRNGYDVYFMVSLLHSIKHYLFTCSCSLCLLTV